MGKARLQRMELFDRWAETDSTRLREGLPGRAALLRAAHGVARGLGLSRDPADAKAGWSATGS